MWLKSPVSADNSARLAGYEAEINVDTARVGVSLLTWAKSLP